MRFIMIEFLEYIRPYVLFACLIMSFGTLFFLIKFIMTDSFFKELREQLGIERFVRKNSRKNSQNDS